MFARIGIFNGAPEGVDGEAAQRAREQMAARLQQMPGFEGMYVFADRHTGRTVALSLWQTDEALRAWDQIRRPIVAEQVATTGRSEQESDNYELVFSTGRLAAAAGSQRLSR